MKYSKLLFLLMSLILIGAGCQTREDKEIDYEDDVYEAIEEVNEDYQVRGSCNAIDTHSTCVDYVGSFWTETDMELNCEGSGTFSTNTCPYTELGGCRATPDTMFETIAWMYSYGGQPIDAEGAMYAQMACDSLEVGQWTTPDALFVGE